MPNHFPSAGGLGSETLLLRSLVYQALFPQMPPFIVSGPLAFPFGVQATISGAAAQARAWAIAFEFTTPGSAGSFDQDYAEAALVQWLGTMSVALEAASGASAGSVAT